MAALHFVAIGNTPVVAELQDLCRTVVSNHTEVQGMPKPTIKIVALAAATGLLAALVHAALAQERDITRLVMRADLNADGRVTRQEFAEARSRLFTRLDRNRDHYLSSEDATGWPFAWRKTDERLRHLMASLDLDQDGRVSRDEFVAGRDDLFALADSNGDDMIDHRELAAMQGAATIRRQP